MESKSALRAKVEAQLLWCSRSDDLLNLAFCRLQEKPQLAESEKDELLKRLQKLEKKQRAEITRSLSMVTRRC